MKAIYAPFTLPFPDALQLEPDNIAPGSIKWEWLRLYPNAALHTDAGSDLDPDIGSDLNLDASSDHTPDAGHIYRSFPRCCTFVFHPPLRRVALCP